MAEDRIPCYTGGMTTTTKHSYATTVAACGTWNQMTDQQRNALTVAAIAHRATDTGAASAAHESVHRLVSETLSRLGLIREVNIDVQHCLMDIAAGDVPPEAPAPPPEPRLESLFAVTLIVRDPEPNDPDDYLDVSVDFSDSYSTTVPVDGSDAGFMGDEHNHSVFLDRLLGTQNGTPGYSPAGQLRRLADYLDGKSGIVDEVAGR